LAQVPFWLWSSLEVACLLTEIACMSCRLYLVYCAHFVLKGGQHCKYIGYTRSIEDRKKNAKTKPPAWMREMLPDTLWYEVLESDIPSIGAARALEAIHAARFVLKDARSNRGGPWLKPTLFPNWKELAQRVAACRSLLSLSALADEMPGGQLDKHLKGQRFETNPDAGPDTPRAARAVPVAKTRSGSSGCPGNETRRRQLDAGDYKEGSPTHRRLVRGVDVQARIRQSNEARKQARASGARRQA